jgi:hypothetical protein
MPYRIRLCEYDMVIVFGFFIYVKAYVEYVTIIL